ncbi:major facilitator superfamily domain-containing protein [Mucidula mucida]|nr:major facilitator superfamily domain-containing protein [Mucidula mucida]
MASLSRTQSSSSIIKVPIDDDLVEEQKEESVRFTDVFKRGRRPVADLDSTATKRSVYDDPNLAPHYWPKKEYENIHRFDPTVRWTVREEKALVRKIDWKANTDNFLPDLGLTTDDYNWANSIFRLAFLSAELPSQLVSKRLGPDRWIPMQMVMWSIVTLAQFWLNGRTTFFLCRALLGFIQGGFIPDLILYLSYFYTKKELPFRLALFWMSSNLCSILASFIAFGVLHMRGVQGKAGWRWLFLVEGLITLCVGLATFFRMPASPTQSKTWFRPKGWFTDREETIAVTRILRDDPTKGDMHNREGLSLKRIWVAICDYDLWPLYFIGLMFGIPTNPPTTYLTLSLRNIGFNTFQTNLLAIPYQVLSMITMFGITMVSELVNDRSIVSMAEDFWVLPFLVAIYCLPSNPNQWVYFVSSAGSEHRSSFVSLYASDPGEYSPETLFKPFLNMMQVAWCSRNSGAVASRTVNASLYNMFVQASSIIGFQIYRADDAPEYRRGNRILIAITCFNVVIMYPATKAYYVWRNKQRDKIWNAMNVEEKKNYLQTTTDVGNRRLDFRFAH